MRVCRTALLVGLAVWCGDAAAQEPRPAPAPGATAPDRVAASLLARLGTPKTLDVQAMAGELAALPEEERGEQLTDWALLAAVAQVDAGAVPDWGRLTPALPPSLRRPFLNDLRELPYGPGRLAMIGPDECVAVVPAAGGTADRPRYRFAVLCRLLDERRMLDGRMPDRVRVVAFDADPRREPPAVALTYVGTLRGATFETPAYGFEVARVRTRSELAEFLRWADDLLGVNYGAGGTIELSGRRYPTGQFRRDYRRLDLADLEAIRRADGEWPGRPNVHSVSALGFSLDPWIDPRPLATELVAFATAPNRFTDDSRRAIETVAGRLARKAPFEVPSAPEDDDTRLYALLDAARQAQGGPRPGPKREETLDDLVQRHTFQSPIYFGRIQGTEVGMTLYYTDLMAKLYMMGGIRQDGGQEEAIELPAKGSGRFRSALEIPLAAFHWAENQRLNRGRLWWGPRPAGFLRLDPDALRFAPVATRLFMKSKAAETAREETASLRFGTFCARWNRAYLAVADDNPEFHRLNQVMKWSVVFLAAEASGRDPWSILDGVAVPDGARFQAWYEQGRAAGRLAGPQRLPFRAAQPGVAGDALEIIRSPEVDPGDGKIHHLEGGVDTATPDQIAGRTVPAGTRPMTGMPPDVAPRAARPDGGGNAARLPLDGGSSLELSNGGRTAAVTGETGPLRTAGLLISTPADAEPLTFRTGLEVDASNGGLIFKEALDRGGRAEPLGELSIPAADGDTISLGWTPRGNDQWVALADAIVSGREARPGTIFATADGRRIFGKVAVPGEPEQWWEITPGTDPNAPGVKVGRPGDPHWVAVTPRASDPIREHRLQPLTGPPYRVVGPFLAGPANQPLPPRRTSSWFRPAEQARATVTIGTGRETLALTPEGELATDGPILGRLFETLSTGGLIGFRSALARGTRDVPPGAWFEIDGSPLQLVREGAGWRLRLNPKLPTAVRGAIEAELAAHPDLLPLIASVRDLTPEIVQDFGRIRRGNLSGKIASREVEDSFLLDDPDARMTHDVAGALEVLQKTGQVPEDSLAVVARRRMLKFDGSTLGSEAEGRLIRQLRATHPDALLVVQEGGPASDRRLEGVLAPNALKDVTAVADVVSLGELKGADRFLPILEKFRARWPGNDPSQPIAADVKFVFLHRNTADTLPADVLRQAEAGTFRDQHVVFVMCNPGDAPRLASLLLARGGVKSVAVSAGILDLHAGMLAADHLSRHPEVLDGLTPVQFTNRVYAKALERLEAGLREIDGGADPAAVLRRDFPNTADEILLDAGGKLKAREVIDSIRETLKTDGASFYLRVDRAEPPRWRLAA